MTGFSKAPCQPSMADPHLRPGRPLRDRRADAQSHIRGYRSSCGPHLASSGAAAGGSLGVARAGLPVRMGNGAPPSPGLGPATSRDAGGPSRAGVAARRIVQPPWRGPSPDAPRSLTAHCPLPTAHCSLLTAHCPLLIAHAARATSVAGAAASCASLPTRGGMRAISAAVAVLASRGTGPRETDPPRRPRGLPGQARACPGIARGAGAPPPLAARRAAPREDPGTLDERPAHERPSAPRDAAPGARVPRGREAEAGRGPSPGRGAGEVPHLGGERERRGEALRPSAHGREAVLCSVKLF